MYSIEASTVASATWRATSLESTGFTNLFPGVHDGGGMKGVHLDPDALHDAIAELSPEQWERMPVVGCHSYEYETTNFVRYSGNHEHDRVRRLRLVEAPVLARLAHRGDV